MFHCRLLTRTVIPTLTVIYFIYLMECSLSVSDTLQYEHRLHLFIPFRPFPPASPTTLHLLVTLPQLNLVPPRQ